MQLSRRMDILYSRHSRSPPAWQPGSRLPRGSPAVAISPRWALPSGSLCERIPLILRRIASYTRSRLRLLADLLVQLVDACGIAEQPLCHLSVVGTIGRRAS